MALGKSVLIFAALIGAVGAFLYFVGIPAEWKQAIQQKIAQEMAESKAKDLAQEQLDKLPEADQQQAEAMASGLDKVTGGDLKNPLGKKDE